MSTALHKQTLHSICQEVLNVLGSLKYHILSLARIARQAPHRASCAASEESNIIRADVDHVERTCANICSLRGMLPCTCFIFVLRQNSSTKHSIPQLAAVIQKSSQRYEACLSRIENKMEMKAVAIQLVAAHDD